MDFTIADGVVALVLLISGALAWSRGFTREALAVAGWIAAALAALYLAPYAEPLLQEIPGAGPVLVGSCTLSKLAAFAVVFAVALILISIFTPLFSSFVQDSALGVIDRGAGFLFGIARGLVLIAVVYLIYAQLIPPADRIPVIDNAASIALIAETSALVSEWTPTAVPSWIMDPVNRLMEDCGGIPALSGTGDEASLGLATMTRG